MTSYVFNGQPLMDVFDKFSVLPKTRCRGIEIGDDNFSGCAYGDGAADGSFGDDVCPACNNTGEETR